MENYLRDRSQYADDTKIYREIRDKHDQEILQKDLDSLSLMDLMTFEIPSKKVL